MVGLTCPGFSLSCVAVTYGHPAILSQKTDYRWPYFHWPLNFITCAFFKEFLLLSDRQWACLSQCRPSRAPVDPRVVLSPVSIPAARLLHVPQALEMQKLYSIIEPRPKPRTNSYLSTIYIGM